MKRALSLTILVVWAGCGSETGPPRAADRPSAVSGPVVVYAALDREFSQPILRIYQRKAGVEVLPVYDAESTKSFGLTARIVAEASAPQCDLFWNNEPLNTIRLARQGLLEPMHPAGAEAIPAAYRDPDGLWYGLAARARIVIVNTELLSDREQWPRSVRDLADPRWRGRAGLAKPLFGTTGTHAACLFAAWGEGPAKAFFRAVRDNQVQILSGNRQVAAQVAAGRLAFGLTDTDDALAELRAGSPVAIVYPDQEESGLGTLFLPNTIARVRNAPHPEAAEALASYLLSGTVEAALAQGPSGQIPLNPSVAVKPPVETPATIRAMAVDWAAAADLWEPIVAPFLTELFAAAGD
ncbi:MAG: iron transporter [Isosphaeraceae bacterium]|jgi:iron(III) transport system substrate-binding protein|nr:MAG: iron transporter [Isosphaeraceae bacterium]